MEATYEHIPERYEQRDDKKYSSQPPKKMSMINRNGLHDKEWIEDECPNIFWGVTEVAKPYAMPIEELPAEEPLPEPQEPELIEITE